MQNNKKFTIPLGRVKIHTDLMSVLCLEVIALSGMSVYQTYRWVKLNNVITEVYDQAVAAGVVTPIKS